MEEIVVVKNSEDENIQTSLKPRRKLHNILRILMETSNKNMKTAIPSNALVGIAVCVVMNYVLLKMYDKKEYRVLILMLLGAYATTCFIIVFLCHHASLPLIYMSKNIWFWKHHYNGSLEKREVGAMHPAGLKLGPYVYAMRETALKINDTALNMTITLLLA
ncbi:unnamed protein product [Orchesella dallaii]|uniref:Uncharacterized protein n=1 Tax=Orchesella dallaii TaxID=48710 RepID=A0ABP1QDJ3_9HEXA